MAKVPESINERSVFVDTAAFLALADRKDQYHKAAITILGRLVAGQYRLFTTMYVVVESHAAIMSTLGTQAGSEFLKHGLGGVSLLQVTRLDELAAEDFIHSRLDHDYSYCDAIGFIVMKRHNVYFAFSYDDHFNHEFYTPLYQEDWP